MEIRVLRYFLTVVREEVGVKLFDRGSRKITLTNEGILLRRRAEEILQLVDKTEKELAEQEEQVEDKVNWQVIKKKQRMCFFEKYASNETIKEFINDLEIDTNYKEIGKYTEEVAKELEKINFPECIILDKEQKTSILIGLAVQYIQGKYNEKTNGTDLLEEILCTREKFLEYLRKNLCVETDERMAAYLQSVILDATDEILKNKNHIGEETVVTLKMFNPEAEEEYIITQKQSDDTLENGGAIEIEINKEKIKDPEIELAKLIDKKTFYKYHFCEMQKTYR